MKRLLIAAAAVAPLTLAAPAWAQDPHAHHQAPASAVEPDPHAGHAAAPPASDPHAGHAAPAEAPPADPHAGHAPPADPPAGHAATPAQADPHAGHEAAPPAADPHAGHQTPTPADPHAGHGAAAADPHAGHGTPLGATQPVGTAPPPEPPTDHAAERFYTPQAMAAARAQLRKEHGGVRWSMVMLETAEVRPSDDGDVYAWEGEASYGGDINRFVLKSEGEGGSGELESAEVQALYSRAIGPYFNMLAGVRHDFEPGPQRTYAALGLEGVAPYWFELEGALFLSDRGDLSARLEGSYDFRLTQNLILEPRVEANLAASADPALELGSGLQDVELGLRLRYAIRQELSPYVGIHYERKFGDTADFARAHGEDVEDTRFVVGLRAFF